MQKWMQCTCNQNMQKYNIHIMHKHIFRYNDFCLKWNLNMYKNAIQNSTKKNIIPAKVKSNRMYYQLQLQEQVQSNYNFMLQIDIHHVNIVQQHNTIKLSTPTQTYSLSPPDAHHLWPLAPASRSDSLLWPLTPGSSSGLYLWPLTLASRSGAPASCFGLLLWPLVPASCSGLLFQPLALASCSSLLLWPLASASCSGLLFQLLTSASCADRHDSHLIQLPVLADRAAGNGIDSHAC